MSLDYQDWISDKGDFLPLILENIESYRPHGKETIRGTYEDLEIRDKMFLLSGKIIYQSIKTV